MLVAISFALAVTLSIAWGWLFTVWWPVTLCLAAALLVRLSIGMLLVSICTLSSVPALLRVLESALVAKSATLWSAEWSALDRCALALLLVPSWAVTNAVVTWTAAEANLLLDGFDFYHRLLMCILYLALYSHVLFACSAHSSLEVRQIGDVATVFGIDCIQ
jgi:hypothetical protein